MGTIERSVIVERPVDVVWDVWTDVRLLPELSQSTTAVTGAPDRLTAPGETFEQTVRAAGRQVHTTWTVTEIEPADHLTITGRPAPGVTVELTEQVEDLGDQRTRLTLRIDYRLPFGPLGAVASRLGVERMARDEAAALLDRLRAVILDRDRRGERRQRAPADQRGPARADRPGARRAHGR
ncbi:MAG: SRPBCC family protein [Acidimicrobiales bacterium]